MSLADIWQWIQETWSSIHAKLDNFWNWLYHADLLEGIKSVLIFAILIGMLIVLNKMDSYIDEKYECDPYFMRKIFRICMSLPLLVFGVIGVGVYLGLKFSDGFNAFLFMVLFGFLVLGYKLYRPGFQYPSKEGK